MYPLTESGAQLEEQLRSAGMSTKEIGAIRVPGLAALARKASADEVPQLIVNVGGMMRDKFPGAMDMNLVGGGRPLLRHEVDIYRDSANDHFAHALAAVALRQPETAGLTTREMYDWVGQRYVPGLFTPATADGHRQMNTQGDFEHWIQGVLAFDKVKQLPPRQRAARLGRIAWQSVSHVARRTNAA